MTDLWIEAVQSIEPLVKPAHRDRWLRPIECLGIEDGKIRLRAPDRYHKEWFEDHFLPPILRDLEARAQRTFSVEFELVEEDGPMVAVPPQSVRPVITDASTPAPPSDLVPRFTFDRFVVGPTNQFAHAAARMV